MKQQKYPNLDSIMAEHENKEVTRYIRFYSTSMFSFVCDVVVDNVEKKSYEIKNGTMIPMDIYETLEGYLARMDIGTKDGLYVMISSNILPVGKVKYVSKNDVNNYYTVDYDKKTVDCMRYGNLKFQVDGTSIEYFDYFITNINNEIKNGQVTPSSIPSTRFIKFNDPRCGGYLIADVVDKVFYWDYGTYSEKFQHKDDSFETFLQKCEKNVVDYSFTREEMQEYSPKARYTIYTHKSGDIYINVVDHKERKVYLCHKDYDVLTDADYTGFLDLTKNYQFIATSLDTFTPRPSVRKYHFKHANVAADVVEVDYINETAVRISLIPMEPDDEVSYDYFMGTLREYYIEETPDFDYDVYYKDNPYYNRSTATVRYFRCGAKDLVWNHVYCLDIKNKKLVWFTLDPNNMRRCTILNDFHFFIREANSQVATGDYIEMTRTEAIEYLRVMEMTRVLENTTLTSLEKTQKIGEILSKTIEIP
jgi:hypothetical protein